MKNLIKYSIFIFICLLSFDAYSNKNSTNLYRKFREKVEDEVIIPLATKYEEIKEDGLTKSDKIAITGTIASIAAIALAYRKRAYIREHSTAFALLGGAGATAGLGYLTYKHIEKTKNSPEYKINKFISKLSQDKQDQIFKDHEILLGDSYENPELLLDSEEFMSILDMNEQDELEQIIRPDSAC